VDEASGGGGGAGATAPPAPPPLNFANEWEAHGTAFTAALTPSSDAPPPSSSSSSPPPPPPPALGAGRPGFWRQVALFAHRSALQRLKGTSALVDAACFTLGGAVIGIVTSGGPLLLLPIPGQYKLSCPPGAETRCNSWLRMAAEPATFYWTMTLGGVAVPPAVRAFGGEKEVFWREAFAGASPGAYYLGKALADLPYFALMSFFFLAPMVAIAPWRGPLDAMYAICLVLAVFIQPLGAALSLAFADPDAATLVGVIIAILLNLFGGFVPMIGNGAVWAYTRWTARAIVAVELVDGHGVGDMFDLLVPDEHRGAQPATDLGNLLLFAAATHAAAYVLLRRTNKARRGWL
jgi:hypothetical protein